MASMRSTTLVKIDHKQYVLIIVVVNVKVGTSWT